MSMPTQRTPSASQREVAAGAGVSGGVGTGGREATAVPMPLTLTDRLFRNGYLSDDLPAAAHRALAGHRLRQATAHQAAEGLDKRVALVWRQCAQHVRVNRVDDLL